MAFTALCDANVLYPAPIRDLLMELAYRGLFRAKWTEKIHDEWILGVLRDRADLTPEKLNRTRLLMNQAIPDCVVEHYEDLIPSLSLPDPNDRHVLAAAIRGRADVIVTQNLKDFPPEALARYGVEAQHPDDFFAHLLSISQPAFYAAARAVRTRLRSPPRSAEEYIDLLEKLGLTMTASSLRQFRQLIE